MGITAQLVLNVRAKRSEEPHGVPAVSRERERVDCRGADG